MFKLFVLVLCGLIASSFSISNSVIDISNWQKTVNFSQLKKAGIAAVIHKASEGTGYTDPYFNRRRTLAQKLGLLFGAYHFAHGGNPLGQADHFLKSVGNIHGVLLVLDLENNPGGANMSPAEAEQFVQRIKVKTGRYPMIYGSPSFLQAYNKPNLNKCSLWVASWRPGNSPGVLPARRNKWVLWQYTNGKSGGTPRTVGGVGACDRDKYNGSLQQLRSKWPNL